MRGVLTALLAATTLASAGRCQEAQNDGGERERAARAAASAKSIAPFVDEEVIAVVRVDLARIDLQTFRDAALKLGGDDAGPELAAQADAAQTAIQRMRDAGCQELFFVASALFPHAPGYLLAVVEPGKRADRVTEMIKAGKLDRELNLKGPDGLYEQVENVLYVGPRVILDRLRKNRPPPRAEVAAALAAAGDAAFQLLLLPSDDQRRVFREVRPTLPQAWGGGDLGIVGEVRFACLTLDLAPAIRLEFLAETTDAAVAEWLKGLWSSLAKVVAGRPEVRQEFPTIDGVLANFTPERLGAQLRMRLNEEGTTALVQGVVLPSIAAAREAARRNATINNLKQIGLALHSYHAANKRFPASASYDKEGRPLLSWRVHLLPHLGQEKLYRQFKLDEPWNSEHNRRLIEQMPAVLASPGGRPRQQGQTTFQVPVAEGTVFHGQEGVPLSEIADGTEHTILAVNVHQDRAATWTEPVDLAVNQEQPLAGLEGQPSGVFQAVFADGHVMNISSEIAPQTIWAMFTRAGKDK